VLGIGGTLSLVMGSVMMTRTVPGVVVPLRFVLPVAVSFAVILLFLGRLALQAQRLRPVTGASGLIGLQGRARTTLGPGVNGQIDIRGEIWRAESTAPLNAGDPVRVTAVNGLTLVVEPVNGYVR
jgi:membrane-bound serine protease (ClpP class)